MGASATTGPAYFVRCGFNTPSGSPFAAASAGEYVFVDCVSLVAGSGTPYFDFSGTGSSSGVNFRRWSGGSNITLDSDNTLSIEVVTGGGQTVVTGGGDAEIRGICRAVTVTSSAGSTTQVACVTGPVTVGGSGGTVNVYGVTSSVTDNSGGTVTITDGSVSATDVGDILEDTGTTIPALIAALNNPTAAAIAAAVWVYATRTLTQSGSSVASAVTGDEIALTRGDTAVINLSSLGVITGYQEVWFSIKERLNDTDANALVVVSSVSGLEVINKDTPGAGETGSITVTDEAAGDLTITISAAAMAQLETCSGRHYDVQWKDASDQIFTLSRGEGKLEIVGDVTRATT